MSKKRLRVAVLVLFAAAAAAAAQTRTDEIEKAPEERARTLQKETVSGLERLMLQFRQRKVMERLSAGYDGLRIQFGSVATGSGFAGGPEFFREDFLKESSHGLSVVSCHRVLNQTTCTGSEELEASPA